jgi:hypothetical protein
MLKYSGFSERLLFLKTLPTKHRRALRRYKRNRRLQSTLRTRRLGFRSNGTNRPSSVKIALRSALFAVFRVVPKLLVAEKDLLAGRKREAGSTVDALKLSVNEIHRAFRLAGNG